MAKKDSMIDTTCILTGKNDHFTDETG